MYAFSGCRRIAIGYFQIGPRTFSASGCRFENPDAVCRDLQSRWGDRASVFGTEGWGFPARLPDGSQAGGKSLWVHTKRGPVLTFGRNGILNSTTKLVYNTNFGRIGSWGFPARLPDGSQAGGKSLWVHSKRGPVPAFGRNGILNCQNGPRLSQRDGFATCRNRTDRLRRAGTNGFL